MVTESPVFFLADAHLRGPGDPNQATLERFLLANKPPAGGLVILGDFFDYLAGPNQAAAKAYAPVLSALRYFAPFHYIEGNHDFDLSKQVLGHNTAIIHPGPATIMLQGLAIRFFHGDRTNPFDIGTRLLRHALQSSPLRLVRDRLMPDQAAYRLALTFASLSRKKDLLGNTRGDKSARRKAALELMHSNADIAVFAHTHKPILEKTPIGVIANPGAAEPGGSYLKLEDGTLSLHRFPAGELLPPDPLPIEPKKSSPRYITT